jgi:hypothetical protein
MHECSLHGSDTSERTLLHPMRLGNWSRPMREMIYMLSITGWVWTGLVALFLLVRLRRLR